MCYNYKEQLEKLKVEKEEQADKNDIAKNILFFIIGAAAIVIGSRLMVNHGSEIAMILGVPERIIAVTLVAVGTSLPELVTTITAIAKKESALSIGNIIGANIIDLSLILPICSLVSGKPLPVIGNCLTIDIPASLIVTLVATLPLLVKQKSSKLLGILLLILYGVYLFITLH